MRRATAKLALAVALTAGALSFAATSEAKPKCPSQGNVCPAYYDPVICANGTVYSNACYAAAACAVGCVPYSGV